jgi:hypothetical protein
MPDTSSAYAYALAHTTNKHRRLAVLMLRVLQHHSPTGQRHAPGEPAIDQGLAAYLVLLSCESRNAWPYRKLAKEFREALALIRELDGIWAGTDRGLSDTAYMLWQPDAFARESAGPRPGVCGWFELALVRQALEEPAPAYA